MPLTWAMLSPMKALKLLSIPLLPALLLGATGCSHKLEGPTPTVNNDAELTFCGADQQFVINGSGFSPMVRNGAKDDAKVDLPDVCLTQTSSDADSGTPDPTEHCVPEEDVSWISKTEMRFAFRSAWAQSIGLRPGWYDVVVRNPDGKVAGDKIRLHVLEDGPIVFWADPGIVYNGISTQIQVYGANLLQIDGVSIRDSASLTSTDLTFQQDPSKTNRVAAVIPSGTAVSTYDIVVHSANGCQAELIRGISTTDTLEPNLVTQVDPAFGSHNEFTPVTISGNGFAQVPRAYLNPQNATAGDGGAATIVATALTSVAWASGTDLNAVVAANPSLPVGVYDLFVVNPDGKVGLLEDAYTVTELPPPVVANVSPNFVPSQTAAQTLTFEGTNFRAPGVTLSCRAPDGSVVAAPTVPAPTGVTATSFNVSVVTSTLPQGTVCVAKVTNDDGSYYEYSAIGLTNSSYNFNVWRAEPGSSMTVARRALAATSGRATRAARFLYAIGGDNGTTAGAFDTVESAPVNVYGQPGTFSVQPVRLPAARTLSSVVTLDRFLYLVGGNDGTAATASVLRAQVLDPLAAPRIDDVSARRAAAAADGGATEGIGAGVWYYRVSAVMAPSDPSNPGGETLPSDPLSVNLSSGFQGSLVLTLFWTQVPNAASYRIYRSPTGTEALGGVRLLAEVQGGTTVSYTDTTVSGAITSTEEPRPLGSTGAWATATTGVPALATARQALGLAVGQDPATPGTWYLYALGGRTAGAGTEIASTERLQITVDPTTGVQTCAPAWVAGAPLSAARAELTGYSVTHTNAPLVPAGTTFIYAGMGTVAGVVNYAAVPAGGALAWSVGAAPGPTYSGYGGVAGAGKLIALGGQGSAPDIGLPASDISATGLNGNWNANGANVMTTPRYLHGGVIESANMFAIGGQSTAGPTATIERSVL